MMKKILSIFVLALGLVSCDEFEVSDNPVNPVVIPQQDSEEQKSEEENSEKQENTKVVITNVEITGSGITAEGTVTLTVGTKLELAAEITPKPEKAIALVWKSSDEKLLSISEDGQLEAKQAGTVKVTVSPADYPDVSASITVTIVDAEVPVGEGKADQSIAESR